MAIQSLSSSRSCWGEYCKQRRHCQDDKPLAVRLLCWLHGSTNWAFILSFISLEPFQVICNLPIIHQVSSLKLTLGSTILTLGKSSKYKTSLVHSYDDFHTAPVWITVDRFFPPESMLNVYTLLCVDINSNFSSAGFPLKAEALSNPKGLPGAKVSRCVFLALVLFHYDD